MRLIPYRNFTAHADIHVFWKFHRKDYVSYVIGTVVISKYAVGTVVKDLLFLEAQPINLKRDVGPEDSISESA